MISIGKISALVLMIVAVSLVSTVLWFQSLKGNNSTSQVETLELSNEHFWGNQTGWTEAAVVVINTGEKDAILRKITIQSIETDWNNVYYWMTDTGPISNELQQTPNELSGSSFNIPIDGKQRTFQQAVTELPLKSSWTIVLYVKNPGNITLNNLQPVVTIAVFSENKLYYKQVNVDITYTFMKTEELKVQSHTWATSRTSISLTVKNTGTGALTLYEVRVNDVAVSNVTYTSGSAMLNAGDSATLRVAPASGTQFTSGVKYEFAVLTATGNKFTYVATAP